MSKASVESSSVFAGLNRSIDEVKYNMQENLEELNKAFTAACENWQDKNAQTCESALSEHNANMRVAIKQLENCGMAIARLSQLAAEYEGI